ncbi:hypothetical protein [Acrocarpospora catenulata]|uniref:hypothetical protein n=1 Tax=Acrocarpospora catenulata TaxID=2836182 RepID=UPI001BDB4422|nr:hypothetical protein [Acrocarpospora catenulata]
MRQEAAGTRDSGNSGISRRSLFGVTIGATAALAVGCASAPAPEQAAPEPPDPELTLLAGVIAGKEQMVSYYQQATLSDADLAGALQPFQQRHLAHLTALRRHLPEKALAEQAVASPSSSSSPVTATDVSVAFLREAERKAAATRPEQLSVASPVLSQLLSSIGACEALHVIALGRLR